MEARELDKICTALNILLDASVENSARAEALKLCESYKSDPRCTEIGFYLSRSSSFPPNTRYYGLLLLKHRIRMNWINLSSEEQMAIKGFTIDLISSCSLDEAKYIKALLANMLNEIAKHVWPQCWSNMLKELIDSPTAKNNSAYVEIIVLFLSALAEDVVIFQNIDNKSRARDLRQGLSIDASFVFDFLLQTLKKEASLVTLYQPSYHDSIVEVTLQTIEAFAEWIKLDFIFMEDAVLFEILFQLFRFDDLRVAAVECFYTIVCRKGHITEREMLAKLTEEKYVDKYFSATKAISNVSNFTQKNFKFLFVMGKAVSNLSQLLFNIWQVNSNVTQTCSIKLASRKKFLELMFFLSSHESKVIAQTVLLSWISFFRHLSVKYDDTINKLIPLLIDFASKNISKNNSARNDFSSFEEACLSDFDELTSILNDHRGYVIEILRSCATASPIVTIQKCFDYVVRKLNTNCGSTEEVHLQFCSVLTFIETVISPAIYSADKCNADLTNVIAQAEELCIKFLSAKTTDLVLVRLYLSCAHGLCKLISKSENNVSLFKLIIDRVFNILDEVPCDLTVIQISALRRHVCSIVVRVAKYHTSILIELMDHFRFLVLQRLDKTPTRLLPFEKVCMFESLILISMKCHDFEQQSLLIADIMSTAAPIAKSQAFNEALLGPYEFASSIGLKAVPSSYTEADNDPSVEIRSNIFYYSSLTLAVLNRTQVPKQESFKPNPSSPHIAQALDHTLALLNLFEILWSPEGRKLIHPENLKALDLRLCEKKNLICQTSELIKNNVDDKVKEHWERIQLFLVLCLDNCYMTLGLIGQTLGSEFYNIYGLQQIVFEKVISNINFLPCMRFKSFLRHFLSPFIKSCPTEKVNEVVSPVLQSYCHCVMDRLESAWNVYGKREQERLEGAESSDDVDEKEDEEILEEQILRVITREHIELFINIIVNKCPNSRKHATESADDSEKFDVFDVEMKPAESSHLDQVTPLGVAIISSMSHEQVLNCALRALCWYDSTTCQKATFLLWPLLKQLMKIKMEMFTKNATQYILQSLLHGLARHGQHAGCEAPLCGLLLLVIQVLKDRQGEAILDVLQLIQENENRAAQEFLEQFDLLNEKKRKVIFRKLVGNIIIRHASQRFRDIPAMNTFPPLQFRRKKTVEIPKADNFGLAELFASN